MNWFKIIKRKIKKKKPSKRSTLEYLRLKETARIVIHERLQFYAPLCGVVYKRVAIRNQRRRWGSCSSAGNLNFSYRVAFLPVELCDYVIVHELCHLKELNHGPAFWLAVEEILPDYKLHIVAIREIEKIGLVLTVE